MIRALVRAVSLAPGLVALAALPVLAGYQAGMEAFKNGDLKRAIEEFQLEVQSHPGFDYGHFMLGVCYLKQKDYDKAISSLKMATELDGDKLAYHVNLAQVYAELGQWDNVVAALEGKTNLSAEPETSAQARFLLGFGYFSLKRYEKATEQLAAARKLLPNEFRVLSTLGTAQFLIGSYDEAIANLSAALRLNPRQGPANQYLGEAYLARAQRETDAREKEILYQSAVRHAEAAVQARAVPDFETLNLLARSYLGANRFQEAVETFSGAIALNPTHGYAHFNKGQALKGLSDWAGAEREYSKAAQLLPEKAEVLAALAYTYEQLAQQGDGAALEQALAYYQRSQAIQASASTREAIARVEEQLRLQASPKR